MKRRRVFVILLASLVTWGCAGAGLPADQPSGERLPLADLHFHPRRGGSPGAVLQEMDRAGVRWAGNGAIGADHVWDSFLQAAPDRFIPFAGQQAIYELIRSYGERAWTLRAPGAVAYVEALEQQLRTGKFRGIGELFVNNLRTHVRAVTPTRYPADSPLMRRLLALAARYRVPLSIHMEAEPGSVGELERLLAADREAPVIWAHCGFTADAALVRRLMEAHPNLLCELSFRDDRYSFFGTLSRRYLVPITGSGRQLDPSWKALLEDRSDRFLVGTDADGGYGDVIAFFRAVLAQLSPEAARRVAHENARRLFRLEDR